MLPDEVAGFIGRSGDTITLDVERGAIRKFADAVGDRNPLYWDDDFARDAGYRAIPAPPGFFGWPAKWSSPLPFFMPIRQELADAVSKAGFGRMLDAGIEFDFLRPVHAGDTLAVTPRFISISEKEAKSGRMLISVLEMTYVNQNGDIVARGRHLTLYR